MVNVAHKPVTTAHLQVPWCDDALIDMLPAIGMAARVGRIETEGRSQREVMVSESSEQPAYNLPQDRDVEGLDYHRHRHRSEELLVGPGIGVARDEQKGRPGRWAPLDRATDCRAVPIRHVEVIDDQVVAVLREVVLRGAAGRDSLDFVALRLQGLRDQLPHLRVVFDEQDPGHEGRDLAQGASGIRRGASRRAVEVNVTRRTGLPNSAKSIAGGDPRALVLLPGEGAQTRVSTDPDGHSRHGLAHPSASDRRHAVHLRRTALIG